MKRIFVLVAILIILPIGCYSVNRIINDNDFKTFLWFTDTEEKIEENIDVKEKTKEDVANKETLVTNEIQNDEKNSFEADKKVASTEAEKPVQSGGSVYLNNSIVNYPRESDFGKHYQAAVKLYNIILNRSSEAVVVHFADDEERLNFRDNISRNVLVSYDSVGISEQNTNKVDEAGNKIYSYSVFRYDFDETVLLAYNACIDAGIYNGMSQKDAVIKINNWICNNMTYEINNGGSYIGFTTGKGQCKTYSLMFQAMCGACGIGCDYVIGQAYTSGTWESHAWNRVYLGGTGYYVDSTWNDSLGNMYLLSNTLWSNHSI